MWWLRQAGDIVAVIVTPEKGEQALIGKVLLELALHPSEVKWVTWPATGFQVSDELFEAFEASEGNAGNAKSATIPAPKEQKVTEFADGTQNLVEAREMKRRGRPPKVKATEEEN